MIYRFRFLFLLAGLLILVGSFWFYLNKPEPEPIIAPRAEKTIRILEGWTNRDIADYLASQDLFPATNFLALVGSDQGTEKISSSFNGPDLKIRYPWLPADKDSLEGYLFPDTYRIFATSTPEEVIIKMLDNFDNKLSPEMRSEITQQGKTIQEIVNLASIIEKEAPITGGEEGDKDAKIIGGIFYNRLKIGQALQSDATLSYIFNDNKPQHSGPELEIDSPYNTYKYRGLPPGPIGNPGLAAIKAAIYPADNNYYYFLTPTGSRDVIYARNYNEHLQNKYKYLR